MPADDRRGTSGAPLDSRAPPLLCGRAAVRVDPVRAALAGRRRAHPRRGELPAAGAAVRLASGAAAQAPPDPGVLKQFHAPAHLVFERIDKNLPGHAAALVPGVWLGASGASMPVVMTGVTGALVFALGAAGDQRPGGVLPTSALWLLSWGDAALPAHAPVGGGTTGTPWLAAWWALLERRASGRRGGLLAVAAWHRPGRDRAAGDDAGVGRSRRRGWSWWWWRASDAA